MTSFKVGSIFNNHTKRRARAIVPAALFLLVIPVAFAQLERAGPVSAANGFPAWYQDKTGISLEFCTPLNDAELAGGWCVLTTGDTTAPENINNFPTQFADEHFFYLANASGTTTFGGKAKLVIALEGIYDGSANSQAVFARVRVDARGLPPGTYKVYHPYGVIGPVTLDAGNDRLFVTEDIGLNCLPGHFECALAGSIGPFLLASPTPGGAQFPPVVGPATGKLYIADPARVGPVTGSPVSQNYFRLVSLSGGGGGGGGGEQEILVSSTGAAGRINDFTINGRLYTTTIPGRVTVDRASYTNDGVTRRVDVFATVVPTTQSRIPGAATLPVTTPNLGYYHGPCSITPGTGALRAPVGQTAIPMRTTGQVSWGQSIPAGAPAHSHQSLRRG